MHGSSGAGYGFMNGPVSLFASEHDQCNFNLRSLFDLEREGTHVSQELLDCICFSPFREIKNRFCRRVLVASSNLII